MAAEYDRYRPRYPEQMIDDVVAMMPGRRLLEIGAGTGIATAGFVARGMDMTCIEPDPQMAAALTAKLAGADAVRVEAVTFEEWSAARSATRSRFDGLVSGQAWHWTDPSTRWANAGAALRGGGVIAVFWNEERYVDPRIGAAYAAVCEQHGIDLTPVREAAKPHVDPERAAGGQPGAGWPATEPDAQPYFTDLRVRRYDWSRRLPVADHVALINTRSWHLVLPAQVRAAATAELIAAFTGYGPAIEFAMTTDLAVAVRR